MNIYFAVSDEMIEKQGMTARLSEVANTYHWTLSHGKSNYGETFLAAMLAISAGDILNAMRQFGVQNPYTICQARIEEKDLLEGMRAALVGDVIWEAHVIITELTRVQ